MFTTGSQTGLNASYMAIIDWTSLAERALLDKRANGSMNV